MIDRTLQDQTQLAILPHLEETEALVSHAIRKETKNDSQVSITALPDLGLANNSTRMKGGFFTGMHIEWESPIPLVPVDATVNSCGVSIYILNQMIPVQEFADRIESAKQKMTASGFNWNFNCGNHFISVCRMTDGRYCAVMHASADEYKRELAGLALYPDTNIWYYDKIRTIYHHDRSRYLRYLIGSPAEKFIDIALSLGEINHRRMSNYAEAIFGPILDHELIHVPHYGMPTASSAAIGCSWQPGRTVLLTLPGKDLYMIENSDDPKWLTPHGFGASIPDPDILYNHNGFHINGKEIVTDADVRALSGKGIRFSSADQTSVDQHIQQLLQKCNAVITECFHPIISINRDGICVFESQ